DGLTQIKDVVTYCADDLDNHIGVLSFNIKGQEAVNIGTLLDGDYNIACRTGLQCAPMVHEQLGTDKLHGTVRMGFGPFNTSEHVDKTLEAIDEIAGFLNR
ncbi:MAG: aminotransferase class V-fold PLP-dependent enzyme, partial [Desulfobacterales bacterium]|nr:aminotransferase class V-fold PLP-dependent enzyme [Desulfobacterales bacterium]